MLAGSADSMCFCCGAPTSITGAACVECGVGLQHAKTTEAGEPLTHGLQDEKMPGDRGARRASPAGPSRHYGDAARRDIAAEPPLGAHIRGEVRPSLLDTAQVSQLSDADLAELETECTSAQDLEARALLLRHHRRIVQQELIRNLQHAHVLHRKLDEAEAHRVAVAEGGRKRLGVVWQAESQKQALILRDSPPART